MIDAARPFLVAPLFALSLAAACNSDEMTSGRVPATPPSGDPPHSANTIEVPFCNSVAPDWVAFQDGDGAWTRATPVLDARITRFRYTFTSQRGAVAAVRVFPPGNRGSSLSVQYGRPDELIIAGDTSTAHCGSPAVNTLLGTVEGIGGSDVVEVSAGFGSSALLAPTQRDFSLRGLVTGPQDILATKFSRVGDAGQLTKIILRRTPQLPDGTLLSSFDFSSAEAVDPVLVRATLEGPELEGAILTTSFRTPYTLSFLGSFAEPATGNHRTIVALPGDLLRGGDSQIASVSVAATADSRRHASTYFVVPGDQTLTLGAQATVPQLSTVSTTPSLRLRASFDTQPDYNRSTSISFQQDQVFVTVAVTGAYAEIAPTGYNLVVPDLSGVSGFRSEWALHANDEIFWTATRIGGSLGLGVNAEPFPGATSRSAERFGSFRP